MAENLEIIIRAKDQASREIGGVGRSLGQLGSVAGKVALGGLALAAGATAGLAYALTGCVKEAMVAEKVQAGLNAVLKSTRGVAGMTTKSINNLATSLSKVTMFEDEAIISAQSLMLTFTSIGKDIFPEATEIALDMSQALGQDLKSSVIQLGKALNSPVEGMTALRRVGVRFTDEQEDMVKALVKSGDLMGAQKLILEELQTEFGGAARAAGQTTAGAFTILQNAIGNVKEEIGTAFLPVLTLLATELGKIVNDWGPKLANFFTELIPKITASIAGLSEAYQAGGLAGLGAKLLADMSTFWATYLAPELSTWPGKFWEWLTGEDGVLATVTTKMNKLPQSIQAWAATVNFAEIGTIIGDWIIGGISIEMESTDTGQRVIGSFLKSLAAAILTMDMAIAKAGAGIGAGLVGAVAGYVAGPEAKKTVTDALNEMLSSVAADIMFGPFAPLVRLSGLVPGYGFGGSYAAGGIVPGREGQPVPILAHGGELVLNREQQAAQETRIYIQTLNLNGIQNVSAFLAQLEALN